MDADEPQSRRRGMFFHVETPELDDIENESAEGMPVRIAPAESLPAGSGQSPARARARRSQPDTDADTVGFQICDRDWQPSTVTHEPLIQLARGDARNATTSPTSSARPKRPNGSSLRTNSAIAAGIGLLTACPTIRQGTESIPAPRCSRECRLWRAAAPSLLPG